MAKSSSSTTKISFRPNKQPTGNQEMAALKKISSGPVQTSPNPKMKSFAGAGK